MPFDVPHSDRSPRNAETTHCSALDDAFAGFHYLKDARARADAERRRGPVEVQHITEPRFIARGLMRAILTNPNLEEPGSTAGRAQSALIQLIESDYLKSWSGRSWVRAIRHLDDLSTLNELTIEVLDRQLVQRVWLDKHAAQAPGSVYSENFIDAKNWRNDLHKLLTDPDRIPAEIEREQQAAADAFVRLAHDVDLDLENIKPE